MFVALERLFIKVRQPKSRAGELIELRRRLRDELASDSESERALAATVHERKIAVTAELHAVSSCTSCATRLPDHYDGGACCSGVTSELFDDNELAALAHAGTRPHHLVAPPGSDVHDGCAFRGPRGCTLEVANRPARCIHYVCDLLRRELHARGRLDALEAKLAGLNHAMQEFTAAHQARRDHEVLAPLIAALIDHS